MLTRKSLIEAMMDEADDWFARRWRMAVRKDRWLMPRKWRKA